MALKPADAAIGRPIRQYFGRELLWSRLGLFSRTHLLMADGVLLARMRWFGFARHEALGETAEGSWTIRSTGWFRLHADVYDPQGLLALAIRKEFRGGKLTTPGGAVFRWRRVGLVRLAIEVIDARDTVLLRCDARRSLFSGKGELVLQPPIVAHPLLTPLTLASWYLVHRLDRRRRARAASS